MRAWGIRAAAALGVAVLTRVMYGPAVVGFDALHSLLWGRQLAHGELPELTAIGAPTPHPLAILAGVLLAPLGHGAVDAISLLSHLAAGALAVAAFEAGRALAGPAAGVVAAAILLTRPAVTLGLLQSLIDLPFGALILAALTVAVRRGSDRVVLVLLAAAGLLRPEAWPLAIAYAAVRLPAVAPRQRAALLAGALAAPLSWALFDLVLAGDPLHSLHTTRTLTERLDRPRGLATALDLAPGYLRDELGAGLSVVAVAAVGIAAVTRPQRAAPVLAMIAIGLGAFLVLGATGLPLLARYLVLPASGLALLAAALLGDWSARGRWLAAAAAVAVATGIPATARALDDRADDTSRRRTDEAALRRVLDAAPAVQRCETIAVSAPLVAPVVAEHLRLAPDAVHQTRGRPDDAVLQRASEPAAAGRPVAARDDDWTLYLSAASSGAC